MSNNEVNWLFTEAHRELVLARSCETKAEQSKLLNSVKKNVNELKRILLETKNGKDT